MCDGAGQPVSVGDALGMLDCALSYYRSDDAGEGRYAPWLAALRERLPAGGAVLDLGCGCGVPVARSLAAAGYQVTGVDRYRGQLARRPGHDVVEPRRCGHLSRLAG